MSCLLPPHAALTSSGLHVGPWITVLPLGTTYAVSGLHSTPRLHVSYNDTSWAHGGGGDPSPASSGTISRGLLGACRLTGCMVGAGLHTHANGLPGVPM